VRSSSIARMQEFSSVTASSYDADALAPLLSEKSADGWDVVSIVSAGTNIVAYLRREKSDDTVTDESPADVDTAFVPVPVDEPVVEEPAAEEPVAEPVEEAPVAEEPVAEPVDEPAGWGTAPETTEPEPEPEPVVAPVAEEPAAAEPAAVESAVPAGWYADPSGRYELRYWDGNAWTEHVSRAGQQFTDPPVA
jgi:Protein of unknown function (DUF2510)